MQEIVELSHMETTTVASSIGFGIEVGASFHLNFWTRKLCGGLDQWF